MNDTTTHAPVTAVAAIIVRDGKVCLIRSKKNGYVLTPGGRLEPGETLDEALIREIREETGLTVTRIGRLLGVDKQPTYTLYIVEADADGELVAGDDAAEAWWGTAEEVRDSAKPRDYPFILDVLRAQKKKQELEALDDAVRYVCASADREIEVEGTRLVSGKALDAVRVERDRLQRACADGLPREVILCPACGQRHIDGANGVEFATKPHHTRREGNGGVGLATDFCWRHTWVHDTTGERIVATVPIPPSGDPFEDAEGLVVRRRVERAIEVQRHLPTARVEVFTAEGALVGHVAPVDEAAPSTSPAPEVPHPYGEGLW